MTDLKGKIIVIEGTDGSGKQTQTKLLKENLERQGYKVFTTSFPKYDSPSSAAVQMYLGGEIRENPRDISPKAAATFYAVDRYITYKTLIEPIYKEKDAVILFDRYVASNIIHQGAKLIEENPESEEELKDFISWLDNFEHGDMGIPKADITIFLNVPIETTIKLRENRANKITGGEKQDIHESDNSHLINASLAGNMAGRLLGWHIIECVEGEKMRTIEDIGDEILKTITK